MLAVTRALMDRYLTAWRNGDVQAAMECYTPDITLQFPAAGGRPDTTVRGRSAVVGTVLTAFAALGDAEMVVDDMLYSHKGAAMFATETAWLDDGPVSWCWAVHYRLRGDKIASISVYVDDQVALERFLSARMQRAS